MKIATWNVNGIRARLEQLSEFAARAAPDVLCLQEIKAAPERIDGVMFLLPEYWSYWHGAGGYSGVSLHLRRAAFRERPRFEHPAFDHECRIAVARADGLVLASVYVPNGGKDYPAKLRFLEAMAAWVAESRARGERLVVCGDMNVTRGDIDLHPTQRKDGAIGQRPDERALFERVLAAGLVDVARALHPADARMFSWWPFWKAARANNLGWRLDYVLASAELAAERAEVAREVGTSDHAPVVVELAAIG